MLGDDILNEYIRRSKRLMRPVSLKPSIHTRAIFIIPNRCRTLSVARILITFLIQQIT